MKNRVYLLIAFCGLLQSVSLWAQQVLYSPFVGAASTTRFEVVGKAGNFYWMLQSKKNHYTKKGSAPWMDDKAVSYQIFDGRMNEVATVTNVFSDSVSKEYLIAGPTHFDELAISTGTDKTTAWLNRYTPDGNLLPQNQMLADFPAAVQANDILLIRSQDKNKILLLGFETVTDAPMRLHAFLFDKDWHLLFQHRYENQKITQPFVQYNFINYPLEQFDNSPVKLANNGEWLMVAPAQSNNNYAIMHFNWMDKTVIHQEIRGIQNASVESLALSLDEQIGEAFVGILINTRVPLVKKARMAHYVLSQCHLDFDTAYRFSTAAGSRDVDENLVEQYFIPVPGKGFMLLKEYGQPYAPGYLNQEINQDKEEAQVVSDVSSAIHKNDYTRFGNLNSSRAKYDRGDLKLFYFPAVPKDSSWSGIINQEQTSSFNEAYLSYVFVPVGGKLMFLYNSLLNNNKYGSSTILDPKGYALNEGMVFWRAANILDFQRSRQISATELIVPYERNGRVGFALINLDTY